MRLASCFSGLTSYSLIYVPVIWVMCQVSLIADLQRRRLFTLASLTPGPASSGDGHEEVSQGPTVAGALPWVVGGTRCFLGSPVCSLAGFNFFSCVPVLKKYRAFFHVQLFFTRGDNWTFYCCLQRVSSVECLFCAGVWKHRGEWDTIPALWVLQPIRDATRPRSQNE